MNRLNKILKIILLFFLIVLLILAQLVIVTFILTFIQELMIQNKDYLILAGNSFYRYVVFFVVITTLLVLMFIQKKKNIKIFTDDFFLMEKLIYNKVFLITFSVCSIVIFTITIFHYDVVYRDKLISHSILNMKGTVYEFKDMKQVNVNIKKYWNGAMNAHYVLVFKNYQVDILGSVINVKNEKDAYDNNILIDKKIKELNIEKNVNDKYLDKYNSSLAKQYQEKLNILFNKIAD